MGDEIVEVFANDHVNLRFGVSQTQAPQEGRGHYYVAKTTESQYQNLVNIVFYISLGH